MMADFVTPRHSAVMERLRRRIEHFRQHHNSCESRYDTATLERLEHERQQTFNLHQRCLQAKAKRSNKHRQPQSSAGEQREQQAAQRDQGAGQRVQGGAGGEHQAAGESGGSAAEQSRNSTLIAVNAAPQTHGDAQRHCKSQKRRASPVTSTPNDHTKNQRRTPESLCSVWAGG
ncbi:mastermind-like protein 1 [Notothenia coriiceps]|uniref:Mastermind-like protein 1 n=1 Tax=Notothenia coriiceps TaxID=8208 RepID=A0A6I9NVP7_9TELE|nr:PREDICTED: mastermind-like protein 1 [Notothenia coriiceps]